MTAFNYQSIFDKSKVYISRALDYDDTNDAASLQLWAALSLELLGKAALAKVHPCLVADPTDPGSLFAACGKPFSTDRKSILAKTVFERLVHLSKNFQGPDKTFCLEIIHRRNSELHSGELPFHAIKRDAWLSKFWRVSETILKMQDQDLIAWLGNARAEKATDEMRLVEIAERIERRIAQHKSNFFKLYKTASDRTQQYKASSILTQSSAARSYFEGVDAENFSQTKCPACKSLAAVCGYDWSSEYSGEPDEDEPWMESVEVTYSTLAFHCPACELHLSGREELDAAGVEDEYIIIETREMKIEQDYGND